ncbi:carboxymuconolactone decarboxylase family protein [Streptomyces sp. NPDC050560]|uniref:carboxymuconolactone decarboxylase family protein n=1 Tax=Streptomyces sp. NPDC050560 TaxID=3365630 RepID=UPI0037A10B19
MPTPFPSPFRFTAPPPPKAATGPTAGVYEQIGRDFGIQNPPTFVVLSSAPTLLTAAWALMRESLLAGPGPRTGKELVSAGVSLANRCAFCVDAHTMLLHATGDHAAAESLAHGRRPADPGQERLLAWGEASRTPGSPRLRPLPFPAAQAPGYVGSALAFHFINRVVSALLTEQLLPGGAQRLRPVRSLLGRTVAAAVRREVEPGLSLPLLHDAQVPGGVPAWAGDTPVGPAYTALRAAALAGEGLLDREEADTVERAVAAWDGGHPPAVGEGVPGRELPGARLALLAAFAPYRITPEDVGAWRSAAHTDHCLVHLVAYGAFRAVDRIETALPMATAAG